MKQLYEFLINSKSTGIIKNINDDFVDLGLSVLWASCNIGAKEETDYGHYYQWGGLKPMDNKQCDWINCPFNNGQFYFDKKFFKSVKDTVAPNGILSKEYDIAFETYGNKCHIPTEEQFNELVYNTKHEWVEKYNNSGINGRLFTGKNGNSIFIPAAGYRNINLMDNNCFAYLWGSSYNQKKLHVGHCMFFRSDRIYIKDDYRCYGFPIRPVKDK